MSKTPCYTVTQRYSVRGPLKIVESKDGEPTKAAAVAKFIAWKKKCIEDYKRAIVEDEAACVEAGELTT